MTSVPMIRLNNGVEIPQVGFGVFQVSPDETERTVSAALEAGYRHIDTAAAYRNEKGVAAALQASGIPRDELFITTKLWNGQQGAEQAPAAFEKSMDRLGLEKLDLYLIHWPTPGRDLYVESWKALQEIYASGRVRAIGVSNFQPSHLGRLAAETDIRPVLNQIELHPFFPQDELRAYHAEHQIVTEAWSPLGQGGELLQHPVVTAVAAAHGVDAAQAVLRWHLQLGNVVIPKSATPARIVSNFDLFSFELSTDEMAQISGLDSGKRLGPDPDDFEVT